MAASTAVRACSEKLRTPFSRSPPLLHSVGATTPTTSPTRSGPATFGLEPRTTPVQSPQSNGMAETFIRTMKRDHVQVSPGARWPRKHCNRSFK
ncbi:MAG: hypothetical protein EOR69_32570 [Mesorhizobium sp.]|nr:MAG: hypothetical protein EOR69_32570 [Mesorhizobium sp.]RWL92167.1 MAG: hypothetical protein EOR70_32425 [Mesorhizobium sp.]